MNTPKITRGRPRKSGLFANIKNNFSPEEADGELESLAAHDSAPPMRPVMRDEDPRSRAAKRAAELRGHSDVVDAIDDFYVDPTVIPDGWTYEWKMHTVYGAEDPSYQVHLARAGWTAVPASRHPEMMPLGSASNHILRKGQLLMECPTEIVEERRRDDLRRARDQVRSKESQLSGTPEGTMTRDHASVKPVIKKSYSPISIPEK